MNAKTTAPGTGGGLGGRTDATRTKEAVQS